MAHRKCAHITIEIWERDSRRGRGGDGTESRNEREREKDKKERSKYSVGERARAHLEEQADGEGGDAEVGVGHEHLEVVLAVADWRLDAVEDAQGRNTCAGLGGVRQHRREHYTPTVSRRSVEGAHKREERRQKIASGV